MPPFKASGFLLIGIFFDLFRFFLDKKTWHGACSEFIRSETTHGLGHNK
jgi:hypothetical protein